MNRWIKFRLGIQLIGYRLLWINFEHQAPSLCWKVFFLVNIKEKYILFIFELWVFFSRLSSHEKFMLRFALDTLNRLISREVIELMFALWNIFAGCEMLRTHIVSFQLQFSFFRRLTIYDLTNVDQVLIRDLAVWLCVGECTNDFLVFFCIFYIYSINVFRPSLYNGIINKKYFISLRTPAS